MKFSLMTYTMQPVMNAGQMSLLEVLRFARGLGFEALEFSMPDFARDGAANIHQALAGLGLAVSCVNGNYQLAAADQATFNQAVDGAKRMIDTAVEYGCGRVMVVPAARGDIDGFSDRDRAAKRIAEGLNQIVGYAQSKQVTVTVEDFPLLLFPLSTVDELLYMLNAVPGLRLTFDNGNFMPAGGDMMEAYACLKPYIANVHIKDWELSPNGEGIVCWDGRIIWGGSHGKGLIDQAPLLRVLKQDGYGGYLAFEYEGMLDHAQETRKGIAYLLNLISS